MKYNHNEEKRSKISKNEIEEDSFDLAGTKTMLEGMGITVLEDPTVLLPGKMK